MKWAEDRLENFLAAYQGRGLEADVELALGADGRMLALRARLYADLGAYLYPTTPVPPTHDRDAPHRRLRDPRGGRRRSSVRATNKVPTGPYRGAGRPEAAY